jgi:uncharacterized protein DUF3618
MGKDVSEVRHEVEAARQDVADAVEALVYKLNAPKRLKERVTTSVRTAKERTTARATDAKEQVTAKASDAKEQMTARLGDIGGNGDGESTETPPPVERFAGESGG